MDLQRFHLPTGYVPIEDIIRFCIVDLRAPPLSENWHELLEESYQKFRKGISSVEVLTSDPYWSGLSAAPTHSCTNSKASPR